MDKDGYKPSLMISTETPSIETSGPLTLEMVDLETTNYSTTLIDKKISELTVEI